MKRFSNLKFFTFVALFAFALFAVSCDKSDDEMTPNTLEDNSLKAGHLPGKSLPPGDLSIAEIAIAEGFDSLVVALSYVDEALQLEPKLVDMFMYGTDQYTVFAPTNEAFAELVGSGNISDLPAELVLNVLLYHVTTGRRAANSVVPKNHPRKIMTLLKGASFKVDNEGVIWAVGNTANIVGSNISASNGIIHVIDTVILPVEL